MIFKRLREDIAAFKERDPAARGAPSIILCYPGFHALVSHRTASWFWRRKFHLIARSISAVSRFLTGIEIHPGARIGKRFVIDHGSGVVIGETAVVGDDVTLYHQVTLGGVAPSVDTKTQRGMKRHPTIGNDVIVGCGAAILGPITVGDCARVGANAVVTKDVPSRVTAVGNPAEVVMPKDKRKAEQFQAYGTPMDGGNPMYAAMENMRAEIQKLSSELAGLKRKQAAGGANGDEGLPRKAGGDGT